MAKKSDIDLTRKMSFWIDIISGKLLEKFFAVYVIYYSASYSNLHRNEGISCFLCNLRLRMPPLPIDITKYLLEPIICKYLYRLHYYLAYNVRLLIIFPDLLSNQLDIVDYVINIGGNRIFISHLPDNTFS